MVSILFYLGISLETGIGDMVRYRVVVFAP